MPIANTRKLTPCIKPIISQRTRRGSPEIISKPTALNTRPIQIENNVLNRSSLPKPTKVAKANIIRANSSGAPNTKATCASGGAKKVNRMTAMVPPIKDANAAPVKAKSAKPCFANGRPSKVVATAVDAPGMPSIIDEIAPPYMAP
jgi:hypothetical protein